MVGAGPVRQPRRTTEEAPVTDKDVAIAELQQAHDRFRDQVADLPDSAYSESFLGTWNLSQVLTHMAGWYGEITPGFSRVARGERPTPEGVDYSDADAWNARFCANPVAGKAALASFDAAYAGYLAAARALDASFYGVDAERGRPKIGNRLLQGAGVHHFEEHGPEVEAWLRGRRA